MSRGRKKKRNWKEFERFTGRIEAALAPLGAVVKCPDHVADIDTGQPRQIDATLRLPATDPKAPVCFECRDRDARQDVRWIEELYGKQRSVGASLMVAVSSQPFYGPAVTKAAAFGIELRVMTPASADDFATWLKTPGVSQKIFECQMSDVEIQLYSGPASGPYDDLQCKEWQEYPAFLDVASNHRLSIGQIFDRVRLSGQWDRSQFLPNDGSDMKRTHKVSFAPNTMKVSARGVLQDVQSLFIDVLWTKKSEFIPFTRKSNYASPQKAIADAAEADVEGGTLGIYRDAATNEKHIRFHPGDAGPAARADGAGVD